MTPFQLCFHSIGVLQFTILAHNLIHHDHVFFNFKLINKVKELKASLLLGPQKYSKRDMCSA